MFNILKNGHGLDRRGAENHRGKLDEMERQPWKGGTWAGRKDLKKIKNTRTIKIHTGKVKS